MVANCRKLRITKLRNVVISVTVMRVVVGCGTVSEHSLHFNEVTFAYQIHHFPTNDGDGYSYVRLILRLSNSAHGLIGIPFRYVVTMLYIGWRCNYLL